MLDLITFDSKKKKKNFGSHFLSLFLSFVYHRCFYLEKLWHDNCTDGTLSALQALHVREEVDSECTRKCFSTCHYKILANLLYPVALDASAELLESRALTSMMQYSSDEGCKAYWMLHSPTMPRWRTTLMAVSRSMWYSSLDRVWLGATTMESP